jgi:hypothetical protein
LGKQLLEVHGERVTSVQKARHENGEELEKIKQKLYEVFCGGGSDDGLL